MKTNPARNNAPGELSRARLKSVLATFFALLALVASVAAQPVATPHNILLLIADDFGIDNLSLYNTNAAASIPYTPNITALAQSGVLFTHFYARPSCSQSRAAIITGRDSFRTGVGVAINPSPSPSSPVLSSNEYTLPQYLSLSGTSQDVNTNTRPYGLTMRR